MAISDSLRGDHAELKLDGRLTFSDMSDYRRRLNKLLSQSVSCMDISLSGLEFMDSAALGMLVVTQEECEKHGVSLSLHQPRGDVQNLLRLTNFYNRFRIVD